MKPANKKTANNTKAVSTRAVALQILLKVIVDGRSLVIARALADPLEARERALAMELVHGVLRWRWKLEFILSGLLTKPLKAKEQALQLLMLLALYELMELSTPEYAVVNEAVKLSRTLGRTWASGLVNAVLRGFVRNRENALSQTAADEQALYSHPHWLIDMLKQDWPAHWSKILQANNQRPPTWLRVNSRQNDITTYKKMLLEQGLEAQTHVSARHALKLERSVDVKSLPGFAQGAVSVQDAGAQLAADLLDVHAGYRVLDLCAAPGGKTCHVLEIQPQLDIMVAVELEEERMQRLRENLQRLQLHAELQVADASYSPAWWDGRTFDRILVDAPCSATGVIRRHSDIKSLRREQDLASLVVVQQQILQQAWPLLSPGGEMLYVTCSVMRRENEEQISRLLADHADAFEVVIEQDWGLRCKHGRQLLPGVDDTDGFYFARLRKTVD